jgi:two-component system, OmpR family, response regulator MtrA
MPSILLVEDDRAVGDSVTLALQSYAYSVRTIRDGALALASWDRPLPDLILLDVMLPGADGLDVCRHIRRESQLPIIMLTARTDPIDVVLGLECGADDYVTKPFEVRVLLARMAAVLRRSTHRPRPERFRCGDIEVDLTARVVTKRGETVHLTPTELRLLLELASHNGEALTRQQLLQRVWEYDLPGDSRLVDVCVQRLRRKIEDDPSDPKLLITLRGFGYRLSAT